MQLSVLITGYTCPIESAFIIILLEAQTKAQAPHPVQFIFLLIGSLFIDFVLNN